MVMVSCRKGYRPLASRTSLISYVLGADSGRYTDAPTYYSAALDTGSHVVTVVESTSVPAASRRAVVGVTVARWMAGGMRAF